MFTQYYNSKFEVGSISSADETNVAFKMHFVLNLKFCLHSMYLKVCLFHSMDSKNENG